MNEIKLVEKLFNLFANVFSKIKRDFNFVRFSTPNKFSFSLRVFDQVITYYLISTISLNF